jgi:UDP-glucose 4-epimerase
VRILITGGLGFIGGRLAQHLQQKGHQVILGSRKATVAPLWLPYAEVALVEWDDGLALERICCGVDVVIQAAGMSAQDCAADPVAALEFNGVGTARLHAAASRVGVSRFIYLSTAHVYASPLVGVISEATCPRNLHPYATSHLAGENVVLSANQRGQIEGIVLRLSNAFGAPAHKDVNCWMLLVNDLCRQALQTNKMVLLSNGSQLRDFISMEQVCSVIEKLSSRDADTLPANILNVGSGVSQSVLEMARLIQHRCKLFLGIEPELSYQGKGPNKKHEVLEFHPTRLEKMGIVVAHDNDVEIDRLLAFCQTSFNPSQSKKA